MNASETLTQKIVFTKEENLGKVGTLKITKNLQEIIDYLHFKIGSTEWSGILFYKLTGGNIDKLKDLEFTAEYFYPMHIGTHSYTEVDIDKDPSLAADTVDAYETFPEAIEMSRGLLHTHHSLGFTSFSPTDMDELKGNCKLYNYYISLIVDFTKNHTAKIAIPTKTKITSESWFKNTFGKLVPIKTKREEDVVLIGDLKVIIENEKSTIPKTEIEIVLDEIAKEFKIDAYKLYNHFKLEKKASDWLKNRITALETKKKQAVIPVQTNLNFGNSVSNYPGYQGYRGAIYDDFFEKPSYNWLPKKKVTDKSKSEQFLSALLNLDSSKTNESIINTLNDLEKLKDDEIEQFEVMLDQNIPIIHQNLYKTDDDIQLKKHCLEALLELSDYEQQVGDSDIYQVITQSLGIYAV